MFHIFNFLWDQCAHVLFMKKINRLLYKKYFYWVSSFKISFYDDNVSQVSQLTRDRMWKCDKSKYLSNNGSVKNNFSKVLKECYWGL